MSRRTASAIGRRGRSCRRTEEGAAMPRILGLMLVAVALVVGVVASRSPADEPRHVVPASKSGDVVVALCDGKTTAEMPGVKEGETPTRAQAQDVADRLMAEWREKNPGRWDD